MPTQPGKVQNFQNVHLIVFPGFRFDAYGDGGINVQWQGDAVTMTTGPDNIPVYAETGINSAVISVTLLPASDAIDFVDRWLRVGPKKLSLRDSNGKTFLVDPKAWVRQRSNLTYNATTNPLVYDLICPNLSGPTGSLN